MRYRATRFACVVFMAIVGVIFWQETAFLQDLDPLPVDATPVKLNPTHPNITQVGALTFLNGFALRSADKRFGGLSGLTLDATGTQLYAVSDDGYWFTAQLQHDATGRLMGFTDWQCAPLLAPNQRPVHGRSGDAEAVTRDLDGTFLVAFEQNHRMWRYPAAPHTLTHPPRLVPTPPELRWAPVNGGIEAVTVLTDGRVLILTEKFVNQDGSHKGWISEAGQFFPLSYVTSAGFSPTDVATLPGGDVLVLERRYNIFTGPGARLRRLSHTGIQADATLRGKELARLTLPMTVDNFEGLAVHTNAQGDTFVYLLSDDNYQFLQRTLLLQFRLSPLSSATAETEPPTAP